jgi:hypothetical protein
MVNRAGVGIARLFVISMFDNACLAALEMTCVRPTRRPPGLEHFRYFTVHLCSPKLDLSCIEHTIAKNM